jgi:hypothetical protein
MTKPTQGELFGKRGEGHMGRTAPQSAPGVFGRRFLVRGAALAGLYAAAVPMLDLLTGPAGASTWRGFVGCIKPRAHDSSLAEMIKLLPAGIGVASVYLNLAEGTREELQNSYATYEKNVAYLAAQRCDTISIEGAPPFMILGPDGEARLVDAWRQKYQTDMFTSSQNQVNVLRAMKVRKILGITAFGPISTRATRNISRIAGSAWSPWEAWMFHSARSPMFPRTSSTPSSRRSFSRIRRRMPSTSWDRAWTRSVSSRRSNRTLAFRSCNPSRRVSGKSSGACMSASRSRAMAACWRPCRPSSRFRRMGRNF